MRRLHEFTDALERNAGVDDTIAVPVLRKLIGVLHDTEAAMAATKLAADLSAAGFGEITETGNMLVQLMQGRMKGAANAFGVALLDANGATRSHVAVMRDLIAAYDGFTEKQNDTRKALDIAAVQWGNVKEQVGDVFAPALTKVLDLFSGGIKIIQTLGSVIGTVSVQLGDLAKGLVSVLDVKRLIIEGPAAYAAAVDEAMKTAWRNIMLGEKAGMEERRAIWKTASTEELNAAEALAGKKKLLEQLRLADLKKSNEAEKALQAEEDKRTAEALRNAEQAAHRYTASVIALDKARVDAARKGSDEELAARMKLLDDEEQALLDAAKGETATQLNITREFYAKRKLLLRDWVAENDKANKAIGLAASTVRDQEIAASKAALLARLKNLKSWEAEYKRIYNEVRLLELQEDIRRARSDVARLAALEKYNNADLALDTATNKAKAQNALVYAQASAGLSAALFGQNKALAIAETIINTASAVVEALPNYVLAAIVAATGAAEIAKIESTDYSGGRGFDDPESDKAAYFAGRRWAKDMIAQASAGFNEGLGGGRGTIINRDESRHSSFSPHSTTNIAITGYVGAGRTEFMKNLKRDLERVDRQVVRPSRVRQ